MKDRPALTLSLDEIPESVRNAWIRQVGNRQPAARFIKALCSHHLRRGDLVAWYAINDSVGCVQVYWGGVWQTCPGVQLEHLDPE